MQYDQLIAQAVERIQDLELLEEEFQLPDAVCVDERLRQSFGVTHEEPMHVAVRFAPAQAPYIRERIWHPTQEVEELDDGGVVLRFTAGGLYEIQSWVLSHGSAAEVLEPEELRQAVQREASATASRYSGGATGRN